MSEFLTYSGLAKLVSPEKVQEVYAQLFKDGKILEAVYFKHKIKINPVLDKDLVEQRINLDLEKNQIEDLVYVLDLLYEKDKDSEYKQMLNPEKVQNAFKQIFIDGKIRDSSQNLENMLKKTGREELIPTILRQLLIYAGRPTDETIQEAYDALIGEGVISKENADKIKSIYEFTEKLPKNMENRTVNVSLKYFLEFNKRTVLAQKKEETKEESAPEWDPW